MEKTEDDPKVVSLLHEVRDHTFPSHEGFLNVMKKIEIINTKKHSSLNCNNILHLHHKDYRTIKVVVSKSVNELVSISILTAGGLIFLLEEFERTPRRVLSLWNIAGTRAKRILRPHRNF